MEDTILPARLAASPAGAAVLMHTGAPDQQHRKVAGLKIRYCRAGFHDFTQCFMAYNNEGRALRGLAIVDCQDYSAPWRLLL